MLGGSMKRSGGRIRPAAVVALVLALSSVGIVGAAGSSGAVPSVRGFDGKTITVAGLGIKSQLPTAETGAEARIKRFNDTNELPGIKIDYKELADDKQDPATALSEARRLVTQVGVFAIVGDVSANNPGQYFAQQHVPYFGGGFDNTYCSNKPSTSLWGFSDGGCITAANPSRVTDIYHAMYTNVSKLTGKKHPTFIVVGNDNESGKNGGRVFAIAAQGAGFKVTDVQTNMPQPPVADYTPFVQAALKGDHGNPPDAMFCEAATQCLNLWQLLKASGYKGAFTHGLFTDILVKPFDGSYVNNPVVNPAEPTAGNAQIRKDLDALKPGLSSNVDLGTEFGYASTDFFIQVLEKVKKNKMAITPENVQKVASTFTFELKGVKGPIQYPKATVMVYPACFSNFKSDGTKWQTVVPYSCSTKTYSPNLKLG
jgi:ABC-type branched-subunit amino acid transport system substrate-binding protein